MNHLAILRGQDLVDKIISGTKTIESRWYMRRSAPWDKIFVGDRVFFKKSCGSIQASARVKKVVQKVFLNEKDFLSTAKKYELEIGVDVVKFIKKIPKYSILIFIDSVKIEKKIKIENKNYGNAWIINPKLCHF